MLVITNESKPKYDSKYSFVDYSNVGKYYALSFTTKQNKLLSFYYQLNEFQNLVPQRDKTKTKTKRECKEIL